MKAKLILSIFAVFAIAASGALFFTSSKTKSVDANMMSAEQFVTTTISQQSQEMPKDKPAVVEKVSTEKTVTKSNEYAQWISQKISAIQSQAKNLNENVLRLSLMAYQNAKKRGLMNDSLITIIDYSKPSTERRLWVVDVEKQKVLFNTLVAHGKNSGLINSNSFSNRNNSLQSSLGVFVTSEIYTGKHGKSLRVRGLESGINDNAYSRSIVFHGANYVSNSIAKSGRLGRSWGCMAVSQDMIRPLINTIKNKTLVFAYYPDKSWIKKSTFLSQ